MSTDESAEHAKSTAVSRSAKALGLAAYVSLSSVLGLGPVVLLVTAHDSPIAGFLNFWRQSLLSDAVFTGGSITVALVACRLVAKRPFRAGVASYFLIILVYATACALLFPPFVSSFWPVLANVLEWGQLGLVFVAVAPLIWRRRLAGVRKV